MSDSLPSRPNLEQLKNQSKDLLKSQKSADNQAIRRIQANHPRFANRSVTEVGEARFSLTDAQLVIAREHGFASWPKLKQHVESILLESDDPLELLQNAFHQDDASLVRELLHRFPQMQSKVNEPVGPFDSPAITGVRSREMLDVLLEAGADINAKSRWWAGGFGLLHGATADLAAYALQRGAVIDVHAAARLGMMDHLRRLVSADPSEVAARGGDGQTPLHFASTVEIAEFLLARGAEIDARDVDHESTPAQYMVRDRQEVARCLVRHRCKTDILMAAALGDMELVCRHLDANPECIHTRVDAEYFPMKNSRAGGTIYQWTLGWHISAHEVARQFGHTDILRLLMERSPTELKLVVSCLEGDEPTVKRLVKQNPGIATALSGGQRSQVAHAARNNKPEAVQLMLEAGFPVDALGQHGATPLHWAAFHGNVEMVKEILKHNPPLEQLDSDFRGTPLGWAVHGSEHGWYSRTGDYAGAVQALLKAGARPPGKIGGSQAVRGILSSKFLEQSKLGQQT